MMKLPVVQDRVCNPSSRGKVKVGKVKTGFKPSGGRADHIFALRPS
jgi:hypothetical protein